MTDGQVVIEINAIDNTSKVLKNIENNTKQSSKTLEQSFNKVQGAMLNLGQAVQGVHNIFETYQNKTRILENAMDRLENATLNLKRANQELTDSYRKLDDIEKQHSRDALNVEQAQLNLETAQTEYNNALAEYGKTSPQGRQALIDLKNAELDLTDAQTKSQEKQDEIVEVQQEIKDKEDAVTVATNGQEKAQRQLEKATGDANWMYVDMGMQLLSVIGNIVALTVAFGGLTISSTGLAIAGLGLQIAWWPLILVILGIVAAIAAAILIINNWDAIVKFLGDTWNWFKNSVILPVWEVLKEIWKWLEFLFIPQFLFWKTVIELLGEAFNWLKDAVLMPVYNWLKDTFMPIIDGIINGIKWVIDNANKIGAGIKGVATSVYNKATGVRDTANAAVYNTGGSTVNINGGNYYGVSSSAIGKSLGGTISGKTNYSSI